MRKTVTLSSDIFEAIDALKDETRLIVYYNIFRSLFKGKTVDYENLPENAASALAFASVGMRRLKANYENGSAKKRPKKPLEDQSALLTEANRSEFKRTEASKNPSDIYSNIYSSNNNYIYQSVISSTTDQRKVNSVGVDELAVVLEQIKSIAPEVHSRLQTIFNKINRGEIFNIYKKPVTKNQIMDKIMSNFRGLTAEELVANLSRVFSTIDRKYLAGEIKNKVRYTITSLYNFEPTSEDDLPYETTPRGTPHGYMERDLKGMAFNSVLTSLEGQDI